MRPDLQGLMINEIDFQQITGVDQVSVMTRPSRASMKERLILVIGSAISAYLAIWLRLSLTNEANLSAISTSSNFIVGLIGASVFLGINLVRNNKFQQKLRQYKNLETLRNLLFEINKYNDIVRIIHIKDQLEDAGNQIDGFDNRSNVVRALQLARADFIRALKTERILRENKDLIAQNPAAFQSNLAAIRALQVNDQGTEWGHILNQALAVAVDVQAEMRRLQDNR